MYIYSGNIKYTSTNFQNSLRFQQFFISINNLQIITLEVENEFFF